mgnify:CR=1 FL=1
MDEKAAKLVSGDLIEIKNPISADLSVMRPSNIPNLLNAINLNKPISFSLRQNYIYQGSMSGEDEELVSNLMILNNISNSGYILINSAV